MLWGNLLHLSFNMWADTPDAVHEMPAYRDELRCDDATWERITAAMAAEGFDTVVVDLGDGVRWESHPEIAVPGAWSTGRLRDELTRLRQLGLTPIPKLNFSATHDTWLGDYGRMLSTEPYYRVCADLIAEASALFDQPRLFHIGMDEETASHQRLWQHATIRKGDLWWHDLFFYADEVTRHGGRAWMWSDYIWDHPETFLSRMPRSILQSNWYYYEPFAADEAGRPRPLTGFDRYLTYLDLDEHGFDQVATGSAFVLLDNIDSTVRFCGGRLDPARFEGFLFAQWWPTMPERLDDHLAAVARVGAARRAHEALTA